MTGASLQLQARALGDPTRYRLFRFVADADAPVDIAALTAHLGVNHNAVRQHLAKLVEAGLIEERTRASGGRGRPRLCYRVAPAADSRWGVTGPYERLSLLLAEAVRTGDAPATVGRRAQRRARGAPGVDEAGELTDPVEAVTDEMARHGFEPLVRRRGRRVELVLQACPFERTALADPAVVCELHLGLAEGVAEASNGRLVVDELVPHDPRRAGCRLRMHVVDAGE